MDIRLHYTELLFHFRQNFSLLILFDYDAQCLRHEIHIAFQDPFYFRDTGLNFARAIGAVQFVQIPFNLLHFLRHLYSSLALIILNYIFKNGMIPHYI